jgi:hypothetical protein
MYNQISYVGYPLTFSIFPQAVSTISSTGRPVITTSGLTAQPISYLSPVRVLNSNPSTVVLQQRPTVNVVQQNPTVNILQRPSSVLQQYIPINNPATTKVSYTPSGITVSQQPQVAIQTNRVVNAGVYSYPQVRLITGYPPNYLVPRYPAQYVMPGMLSFGIWSSP